MWHELWIEEGWEEHKQLNTLIPAVFTHTGTPKNVQNQAIKRNQEKEGEMMNYKNTAPADLNID